MPRFGSWFQTARSVFLFGFPLNQTAKQGDRLQKEDEPPISVCLDRPKLLQLCPGAIDKGSLQLAQVNARIDGLPNVVEDV